MNIETLFKHPAFTGLAPAQTSLLRQFANDIQGKGGTEIARLYMQLNQKMSQLSPLSPSQKSAIVDAVRGYLPEPNRHKLDGFIKMFGR
jgi:hypothetical protein